MPRHIFIKSLEIMALVLIALSSVVGCDRQPVPPYNNLGGRLLLEACQAMAEGRDDEALAALRQLVDLEPGNSFAVDALRHEERRRHLNTANMILASGDYHQLRLFLAGVEKDGDSSPELLSLRDVADGLEALAAVCARRPWESSADLEKALERLTPHADALADSSRFQNFYRQLQADLAVLRQRERDANIVAALMVLDEAVFAGDAHAAELSSAFVRNFPEHVFSKYRRQLPGLASADAVRRLRAGSGPSVMAGEALALSVAGVLVWEKLAPAVRAELARGQGQETSPGAWCRRWILARQQDTASEYEKLFAVLRSERPQVGLPPALVGRYVSRGLVTGQQLRAWCWLSPCPGLTELLSRLQQIRTQNIPNSTRNP